MNEATLTGRVKNRETHGLISEERQPSVLSEEMGADLAPYRSRTIAMVRRYARVSIEVGRLPSLLGKEFFRSAGGVETRKNFEDRVIFVADMENSLEKLSQVEQKLIAMNIIEDYGTLEVARLMECTPRNVRRRVGRAVDQLSKILIDHGLLEASCSSEGPEHLSREVSGQTDVSNSNKDRNICVDKFRVLHEI